MKCWQMALASIVALVGFSAQAGSEKETKSLFKKWAEIKQVFPGNPEPLGAYDAGCLSGATQLDADGSGYALMRLSRHRAYSHPDMKTYLHALGEKLQSQKMPVLLVGDVSPPRGGPMLNGHSSHQIGLDVDLWLNMSKKRPSRSQRETWGATSFVKKRKKLRKNWSSTQTELVATAASFDAVDRIFVSPAIKKYFCETQPSSQWLYKLRGWWGHEEHIHVRLRCPAGATNCVSKNQALNPADNGCGSDLEWWFSKEADEEAVKKAHDHTPREFPTLPSECDKMVTQL